MPSPPCRGRSPCPRAPLTPLDDVHGGGHRPGARVFQRFLSAKRALQRFPLPPTALTPPRRRSAPPLRLRLRGTSCLRAPPPPSPSFPTGTAQRCLSPLATARPFLPSPTPLSPLSSRETPPRQRGPGRLPSPKMAADNPLPMEGAGRTGQGGARRRARERYGGREGTNAAAAAPPQEEWRLWWHCRKARAEHSVKSRGGPAAPACRSPRRVPPPAAGRHGSLRTAPRPPSPSVRGLRRGAGGEPAPPGETRGVTERAGSGWEGP